MAKQVVEYEIKVKDGVSPAVDKIQKKTSGLKSTFKSLAPALGVGAVVAGITKVINVNKNFEKSVSTLSSLTGKQGDELDFLRQKAKEMGTQTTLSATQAADAMTLIGSRFPDLLKSSDGLAAVTNEAAILAEAAGIEMPQAAAALTGALNQFALGSGDARDVIDTLAAGSKAGAADINFLNAAIEKGGATAAAAGVSFKETVAAIETIAPKVTEPTTAGLQLKNVFLELSKGADEFNPSVVGTRKALDNLAKAGFGDVGKAAEKFGKVSAVGAATLIQQRDKFSEFTDAVSVTGVALEQQRINNDNLDGSLKSLGSALEGLSITLGSILEPVIRLTVQGLTSLIRFISDNIDIVAILAAGVTAYAVAANAAAIVTKTVAFATKIQTGAQWLLNAAMNANPIGLIIAGLAALAAGFVIAWRKSEEFRGVLLGAWEVIKTIGQNIFKVMIEPLMAYKDIFEGIIAAFSGEGFDKLFAGIKRLGKSFITFLVQPLLQIAKLIDGVAGTDLAGAIQRFTGAADVTDGVADSAAEGYKKGLDSFAKEQGKEKGASVPIGAAATGIAGTTGTAGGGVSSSTTGKVSGDVSGAKGSKLTNINININKLVEALNINTTNLTEGAAQTREIIAKELLTAVNDVNIISG